MALISAGAAPTAAGGGRIDVKLGIMESFRYLQGRMASLGYDLYLTGVKIKGISRYMLVRRATGEVLGDGLTPGQVICRLHNIERAAAREAAVAAADARSKAWRVPQARCARKGFAANPIASHDGNPMLVVERCGLCRVFYEPEQVVAWLERVFTLEAVEAGAIA